MIIVITSKNQNSNSDWSYGTVMQIDKAPINNGLRVSKVPWKFRIPTIYNFH